MSIAKLDYVEFAQELFAGLQNTELSTRLYDKEDIHLRGIQKRDEGNVYKNDTNTKYRFFIDFPVESHIYSIDIKKFYNKYQTEDYSLNMAIIDCNDSLNKEYSNTLDEINYLKNELSR